MGLIRALTKLTKIYLVLNVLIAFTGSIVRITGSGLGCSNWPNCTDSSFFPKISFHPIIEFSNRGITVLLLAVLLSSIYLTFKQKSNRALRLLLIVELVLLLAQAVVGGLSVIMSLRRYMVYVHFALSVLGIDLAAYTFSKAKDIEKTDCSSDSQTESTNKGNIFNNFLIYIKKSILKKRYVERGGDTSKNRDINSAYPIRLFRSPETYWRIAFIAVHIQILLGALVSRRGKWTGEEHIADNHAAGYMPLLAIHMLIALFIFVISTPNFLFLILLQTVIGAVSFMVPVTIPFHVLIASSLLSVYSYNFFRSKYFLHSSKKT